jgi:transcriptional regulator with XRE-family HTH domain
MTPEALARIDRAIGGRIRLRRAMLGMSQKQLGVAIGLTPQQVQKYEKGTNRIAVSTLARVGDALGVPVSFFYVDAKPARGGRRAQADSAIVASMADRRETLDLLRTFHRLEDPALRRQLVDFVRQISRSSALAKRGSGRAELA